MSATIHLLPSAIRAPADGSSFVVPARSVRAAAAELTRRGITWGWAGSCTYDCDLNVVPDHPEVFFIDASRREVAYYSDTRREVLIHQQGRAWPRRLLVMLSERLQNEALHA